MDDFKNVLGILESYNLNVRYIIRRGGWMVRRLLYLIKIVSILEERF